MFRRPFTRALTGAAVVSVPTVGVPPQVGMFVVVCGVGTFGMGVATGKSVNVPVGSSVSATIATVGFLVGLPDGVGVGFFVGLLDGETVGFLVGLTDGSGVG